MCHSVCHSALSWAHANHVLVGIILVIDALLIIRLAVRGRWLLVITLIASWVIIAALLAWALP